MSRYRASWPTGSTVATTSEPAMACRFLPCTPRPATTTLNRRRLSLWTDPLVARAALHRVDLAENVVRCHRQIAFHLAFVRGCKSTKDGGDHVRAVGDHGKRRISKERVAGADGVYDTLGKAL